MKRSSPLLLLAVTGYTLLLTGTGTAQNIDNDWWKKTIVYQIYPRSFQDSDGDGVGDIQGIISRLDYFDYLNVETIWLSPIYPSPMADFGYDVSDYVDIEPLFGNMQDFEQLVEELHKRGMKLIMDFIPNHTSDQHAWFQASRLGGNPEENPYVNYYRWHDGIVGEDGERKPPNNWLSIFGDSMWQWDEMRQQYYLHQFVPGQPDLDYRNPDVRKSILDSIEFWIRKGVDGLRIDAIHTMFETEEVVGMDEPRSNKPGYTERESDYLSHIYTQHLDEIHDVMREWRDMMDAYEKETGKHIYMVMEIYSENMDDIIKYFHSGPDQPFNFNLIYVNQSCGGSCMKALLDSFLDNVPEGKWPSHVLGNHDNKRITTRRGPEYADALNVLLLTLPGTPTTYYGEELAQRDVKVAFEDLQDPWGKTYGEELFEKYTRDPCRAPMQWDASPNAGFTSAERSWIPVNPDYVSRNVENQKSDASGKSSLQIYRALAALRRAPGFASTSMTYHVVDDSILSYVRHNDDSDDLYLVAINFGAEREERSYMRPLYNPAYTRGVVKVSTGPARTEGDIVGLSSIGLDAGEALVIQLLQPGQDEL